MYDSINEERTKECTSAITKPVLEFQKEAIIKINIKKDHPQDKKH